MFQASRIKFQKPSFLFYPLDGQIRVSIRGVKSLGGHFACLCWGFDFYEEKKNCIFQKDNENILTLLIIIFVKSIQKEQIASPSMTSNMPE